MTDLPEKLARAGVATHLVTFDAEAGLLEADALNGLVAATSGTVFRLGPFRYMLDGGGAQDVAEAVGAGIAGLLGDVALEISALPAPGPLSGPEDADARAVLLLRAMVGSVDAAIEPISPPVRAVIDAGFAVRAAQLTAQGLSALTVDDGRADQLDLRLDQIEQAVARVAAQTGALGDLMPREPDLGPVLRRLDEVESACLTVAERLAQIAATPPPEDRDTAVIAQIEQRLDGIDRHLRQLAEAPPAPSADHLVSFNRFSVALQGILRRLDAQVGQIEQSGARLESAAVGADATGTAIGRSVDRVGQAQADLQMRTDALCEALDAVRLRLDAAAPDGTTAREPDEQTRRVGRAMAEVLAGMQMTGRLTAELDAPGAAPCDSDAPHPENRFVGNKA
jgi:hypothetical protein